MYYRKFDMRQIIRCVFVAVALSGIVWLIISICKPTFSDQLTKEISQRFPPGTNRQTIEEWLRTQPTTFDTLDHVADLIGHANVVQLAAVDSNKLGFTIRAYYHVTRYFIPHEIKVYFFFDMDDRLIKYWLNESSKSF